MHDARGRSGRSRSRRGRSPSPRRRPRAPGPRSPRAPPSTSAAAPRRAGRATSSGRGGSERRWRSVCRVAPSWRLTAPSGPSASPRTSSVLAPADVHDHDRPGAGGHRRGARRRSDPRLLVAAQHAAARRPGGAGRRRPPRRGWARRAPRSSPRRRPGRARSRRSARRSPARQASSRPRASGAMVPSGPAPRRRPVTVATRSPRRAAGLPAGAEEQAHGVGPDVDDREPPGGRRHRPGSAAGSAAWPTPRRRCAPARRAPGRAPRATRVPAAPRPGGRAAAASAGPRGRSASAPSEAAAAPARFLRGLEHAPEAQAADRQHHEGGQHQHPEHDGRQGHGVVDDEVHPAQYRSRSYRAPVMEAPERIDCRGAAPRRRGRRVRARRGPRRRRRNVVVDGARLPSHGPLAVPLARQRHARRAARRHERPDRRALPGAATPRGPEVAAVTNNHYDEDGLFGDLAAAGAARRGLARARAGDRGGGGRRLRDLDRPLGAAGRDRGDGDGRARDDAVPRGGAHPRAAPAAATPPARSTWRSCRARAACSPTPAATGMPVATALGGDRGRHRAARRRATRRSRTARPPTSRSCARRARCDPWRSTRAPAACASSPPSPTAPSPCGHRYETWVDYASRPLPPRVDLARWRRGSRQRRSGPGRWLFEGVAPIRPRGYARRRPRPAGPLLARRRAAGRGGGGGLGPGGVGKLGGREAARGAQVSEDEARRRVRQLLLSGDNTLKNRTTTRRGSAARARGTRTPSPSPARPVSTTRWSSLAPPGRA